MTTSTGSDGGAGDQGAGGGAAALLDAGAGSAGGAGDAGASGGAGTGAAGGTPATVPDWAKVFSAEPLGANEPSPQDWIATKGFKSMDEIVRSARESEKALHGRVAVPKDGDPQEKWDAFYKAAGRPEAADGYEIKAPEGYEANPEFTGRFREVLFKTGASSATAAALVDWYNGETVAALQAEAAAEKASGDRLKAEWGAQFGANSEVARRGMQLLGVDGGALNQMAKGMGIDGAIKLMHKIGAMTSEDMLKGGTGREGFTVSAETAGAKLAAFQGDPAKVAALRAGDARAKHEYDGLIAANAAALDAKRKNL